ncbi:HEPN domain-containing protein [Pseudoalteromonas sp. S558]|uniref:HEPN domain-containing protein n=1 Tax=Pseudoalteromonas sp. S558 TaxID=2066515 RepID=UPI00110B95C3|nr:HEPN domain-containing protein [Pseudoalteromonas sp. S558]TMN94761.1 hypothetical protein CWB66_19090 [Pseudoalteromonas sp. S558]
MSITKDHLIEIQEEQADKWIRERLSKEELDENSDEYQELMQEYSDYQEHLWEEAEWKAELKWLKENGSSNIHNIFVTELDALKIMVKTNLENSSKLAFMLHTNMTIKMSYAYAVTLLESFLGDTLKSLITERSEFLSNAIKNVEEVKKAKYSIAELATTELNIGSLALRNISEILFHNIPKVIKVYEQVLDQKLNIDISTVSKITSLRHDIVHRNGHTKSNEPINLTVQDLYQAIDDIKAFASDLQIKVNEL